MLMTSLPSPNETVSLAEPPEIETVLLPVVPTTDWLPEPTSVMLSFPSPDEIVLAVAVLVIVSLPLLAPVPVVMVALVPFVTVIFLLPISVVIESLPVPVTAMTSLPEPDEIVLFVA